MKTSCWRDRDDGDLDIVGSLCYTDLFVSVMEQGEGSVRHLLNMLWGALLDWVWYAGIPAVTIMSFGLLIWAMVKFIA